MSDCLWRDLDCSESCAVNLSCVLVHVVDSLQVVWEWLQQITYCPDWCLVFVGCSTLLAVRIVTDVDTVPNPNRCLALLRSQDVLYFAPCDYTPLCFEFELVYITASFQPKPQAPKVENISIVSLDVVAIYDTSVNLSCMY